MLVFVCLYKFMCVYFCESTATNNIDYKSSYDYNHNCTFSTQPNQCLEMGLIIGYRSIVDVTICEYIMPYEYFKRTLSIILGFVRINFVNFDTI